MSYYTTPNRIYWSERKEVVRKFIKDTRIAKKEAEQLEMSKLEEDDELNKLINRLMQIQFKVDRDDFPRIVNGYFLLNDKLQMKFLQKELEKTLSENAERIFALMFNLNGLNLFRPTLDSSKVLCQKEKNCVMTLLS